MQVLCDLQGIFLLFNCQTPVIQLSNSRKVCPKYFVDHEDAWEEFRQNVRRAMDRTLEN